MLGGGRGAQPLGDEPSAWSSGQERCAEAGLQRFAVAAVELADALEAELGQGGDLGVVDAEGGDGQFGRRSGSSAAVAMAPGRKRARPSGADGIGDGAEDGEAERAQPAGQPLQHRLLAAEEVGGAGDVEAEVAVGGVVRQHADEGAGVGVPAGELGEDVAQVIVVDLADVEAGKLGAGVGEVLPDPQAGVEGGGVDGGEPHGVFLTLPQDDGANKVGLSPP